MSVRKIAFWLTLILIFTIPWEDSISISIGTGSSITKLFGLGVAGFWFLTIVVEGRFLKPTIFHALVAFFFIWSILSYWWTSDIAYGYERVKTYAQMFILLLVVWEMLQKPDELKAGMQAYLLGAFVLIVSSIYNYLHGMAAVSYEVRFSATGVNAVDLALFLLLGLPMAWHLFIHTSKRNWILKYINLAYLPLAVFTVLLTASRTSLFAAVPALIFIAWPKRLDAGRILLTLIILVFSAVLLRALLPASIFERLSSAATSISSADIGGRVSLWEATVWVFTQHPFFGSGSGSLSPLIGSLAHQTFLSVLAETGLIGFFLFIGVLIYVFLQILKLPEGYLGLWLSTFCVWCIGVLSLSFEFRKITWLLFTFMIIQGNSLRKQWQSQRDKLKASEEEESYGTASPADSKMLPDYMSEDEGLL